MEVTLHVNVCDVCVDQGRDAATELRPVERFEVKRDNEAPVVKFLCSTHSRAFDVFLGRAKPPGRKPATAKKAASGARTGRRGRGVRKTTMSAIEASKGA